MDKNISDNTINKDLLAFIDEILPDLKKVKKLHDAVIDGKENIIKIVNNYISVDSIIFIKAWKYFVKGVENISDWDNEKVAGYIMNLGHDDFTAFSEYLLINSIDYTKLKEGIRFEAEKYQISTLLTATSLDHFIFGYPGIQSLFPLDQLYPGTYEEEQKVNSLKFDLYMLAYAPNIGMIYIMQKHPDIYWEIRKQQKNRILSEEDIIQQERELFRNKFKSESESKIELDHSVFGKMILQELNYHESFQNALQTYFKLEGLKNRLKYISIHPSDVESVKNLKKEELNNITKETLDRILNFLHIKDPAAEENYRQYYQYSKSEDKTNGTWAITPMENKSVQDENLENLFTILNYYSYFDSTYRLSVFDQPGYKNGYSVDTILNVKELKRISRLLKSADFENQPVSEPAGLLGLCYHLFIRELTYDPFSQLFTAKVDLDGLEQLASEYNLEIKECKETIQQIAAKITETLSSYPLEDRKKLKIDDEKPVDALTRKSYYYVYDLLESSSQQTQIEVITNLKEGFEQRFNDFFQERFYLLMDWIGSKIPPADHEIIKFTLGSSAISMANDNYAPVLTTEKRKIYIFTYFDHLLGFIKNFKEKSKSGPSMTFIIHTGSGSWTLKELMTVGDDFNQQAYKESVIITQPVRVILSGGNAAYFEQLNITGPGGMVLYKKPLRMF